MGTLVKFIVIIYNMAGDCKVAHKHIARVAVSLTTQTLDHFVRIRKWPLLGGRGREWGSRGGREEGLLCVGGRRRGFLLGGKVGRGR